MPFVRGFGRVWTIGSARRPAQARAVTGPPGVPARGPMPPSRGIVGISAQKPLTEGGLARYAVAGSSGPRSAGERKRDPPRASRVCSPRRSVRSRVFACSACLPVTAVPRRPVNAGPWVRPVRSTLRPPLCGWPGPAGSASSNRCGWPRQLSLPNGRRVVAVRKRRRPRATCPNRRARQRTPLRTLSLPTRGVQMPGFPWCHPIPAALGPQPDAAVAFAARPTPRRSTPRGPRKSP
jgi:hypothetical protein